MYKAEQLIEVLRDADSRGYIGEAVSQLEHGLQAAHFASQACKDEEVILACLFHDIGHLCADEDAEQMDWAGVADHENLGAQILKEAGFSERVAELVASHVNAKRYLASKDGYCENLSPASLLTLEHQGGKMDADEAESFRNHEDFKNYLLVRACDDKAKVVDLEVAGLDHYIEMVHRHIG